MSELNGLSDDGFKPASSTLFSDPADLDILEQLGSNKGIAESALSRMSLYDKFDPLVDLPVADPRRARIDVRRKKRGVTFDSRLGQLEPEESMLLMGTPRPGQSHMVPVVKNQTSVTSNDFLCSDIPEGRTKKIPKKSCPLTNMSELNGLSDDDFKPASSTLFSDPADLDILEQLGSNKGIAESALSRMSLYVKFDPLVDLPVADPRRASIDVRRKKRGVAFDSRLGQLEPEESMLLMGTPRPGQSHMVPVVKNQTSVTSNDFLCSDIPEGRTEVTDVIKYTLSLNQTEGDDEVLQYTEADISQIKQRLALTFQGILLKNQKEWSQKLAEEEKRSKQLELRVKMRTKIQTNAEDKVNELMYVL
ncbi:uncharacterized protein LOC133185639 [Saccostrea echinata]|uniref:uncharacterized protein LOC133185639 n=1 Tax=Saccostrea echinata TaxID=191078 RepID=UPI002A82ECF0|nr:uncharacterized protein LOC133185639 [Saccostrea echinata]